MEDCVGVEVEELLSVRGRFDAPLPPPPRRRFGLAMGRAGSVRVWRLGACVRWVTAEKPGKNRRSATAVRPIATPDCHSPTCHCGCGAVESS